MSEAKPTKPEAAPAGPALSAAIETGSRVSIWLSERF
jgi:hypothetical protein